MFNKGKLEFSDYMLSSFKKCELFFSAMKQFWFFKPLLTCKAQELREINFYFHSLLSNQHIEANSILSPYRAPSNHKDWATFSALSVTQKTHPKKTRGSVSNAGPRPWYRRKIFSQSHGRSHERLIFSSRSTFSVLCTPLELQVFQSPAEIQGWGVNTGPHKDTQGGKQVGRPLSGPISGHGHAAVSDSITRLLGLLQSKQYSPYDTSTWKDFVLITNNGYHRLNNNLRQGESSRVLEIKAWRQERQLANKVDQSWKELVTDSLGFLCFQLQRADTFVTQLSPKQNAGLAFHCSFSKEACIRKNREERIWAESFLWGTCPVLFHGLPPGRQTTIPQLISLIKLCCETAEWLTIP